jgi:hypothetical protein
MYTILGYICIFRFSELGFHKFKEIVHPLEPTKVANFMTYLFDHENLDSIHRATWMKTKDLTYVEDHLISQLKKHISTSQQYCQELMQHALDIAADEQRKKEAQAKGEVGLPKVEKKPSTIPMPPRLTQPKIPILLTPERISTEVVAKPVPNFLNKTNLQEIQMKKQAEKSKIQEETMKKYLTNTKKNTFQFHEPKYEHFKPIETLRQEIAAKEAATLQFNASFYHPPPTAILQRTSAGTGEASYKENTAVILREDALLRKQQAKDAEILKKYESELRDPTEYYLWQAKLRQEDSLEKLEQVTLRRQQAKESAEEAKLAMERQREDNQRIANLIREQNLVIEQKKMTESTIDQLEKQRMVQKIVSDRETKPIEAVQQKILKNQEIAKELRSTLEILQQQKLEEEEQLELTKADRIRQLRALNTIHKEHIVIFDPTETAGIGLLDEMSYLEMKKRQEQARIREEELRQRKLQEIQEMKMKKQTKLASKKQSILQMRQLKAANNISVREQTLLRREQENIALQQARQLADQQWEEEMQRREQQKEIEKQNLQAEQERLLRQRQYLGAAQSQVMAMREEQMTLAQQRQAKQLQQTAQEQARLEYETYIKEKKNKEYLQKKQRQEQESLEKIKQEEIAYEKQASMEKMKETTLYKKDMFATIQQQHEHTKTVLQETNPYAHRISQELRKVATNSAH